MTTQQAFALALQHHQAGRLADAEALYRKILAVQPNHAEALHRLGIIAHQASRPDLAVDWISQALALDPDNPDAHSNLGNALRERGQLDEAVAAYRRALELKPDYPEILYNLGNVLRERGRLEEAVVAYRRAVELKPDLATAHNNLGGALAEQGQLDDAVAAFRRALAIDAGYATAHVNLGNTLKNQGLLDEAMASFRRAVELQPENAETHSNLVHTLHCHPACNDRTIAAEQQRWNRQFSDPLKPFVLPHANDRSPERRLRIGYVSPDFWDHVVGRNVRPLFTHHADRNFEIVCYSGVWKPDAFTEEFRRHAGLWRSTVGVGDEALAAMIRRDDVDILVDLTLHMEGNRLPVFARQPAPVQVSFASYPASTGLEAIGYRISDRYLEAPSLQTSNIAPEQVLLIDSFWCYDPCGLELEVNTLPAQRSGRVTFGSLNQFCKINEAVLRLWARVLGEVPDSRLVLLSGRGNHRQRTQEMLERAGVETQRVEFVERCSRRAYLELYHRLDIVLDPFPYNGHTTSLDALWMGVPVISLAGGQAVARAGFSQMSNLGRPELAAFSEDDYVAIATQLAHDLPRLAKLRRTLRPRMEASPLMDAPRFARNIEATYRTMWQRWCAENQSGHV